MISFRFHLVSITAVFLAIAIGVVVGSTYVDRAVVENLERRIDTVSGNLDERKQQNDDLERDLDDVRSYITASADFAVTDRLLDVPVLILAMRGVDGEAAQEIGLLARRAGGIVPGVVWVERKWSLESDDDRAALAGVIGAGERDSVSRLQALAWAAVVDELRVPPMPDADPAGPPTTAPPTTQVLADLQSSGFLTVDALDDASTTLAGLRGTSPRVVVVAGSQQDEQLEAVVAMVISAQVGAGLPTVAAEVFREETDGPARAELLRDAIPEEQRDRVVIVDHADQPEGRVASVIALAAAAEGLVGHFGYGSDSDGVLPGWTPP
ncbi:MAG: copper transporter [Acidimicrobiales bacterium]|nr:copper transporter [Acidimicrobiales bacterium]